MGVKAVFIGNMVGGDDGIGPYLFERLKEDKRLAHLEMLELGVIGFDLISYVDDDDSLIIVDAIQATEGFGEVVVLGEEDFREDLKPISQHDFGVEKTVQILRSYLPGLKGVRLIGIKVDSITPFTVGLSPTLTSRIKDIENQVVENLLALAEEHEKEG